ncbi:MAG: GrpB family protein, partial [Candidatus Bathyarchaeia archaeon]
MGKTIKIVDYDPQWAVLYEDEKRKILEVIGDKIVEIEHIGSTAVHNLGAEPIIDIIVAVPQLSDAEECIEPLQN